METLVKNTDEQLQADIEILKTERPLFEANYVNLGGSLQFLKWSECHDGTGTYQPDWTAIKNMQDSDLDDVPDDLEIDDTPIDLSEDEINFDGDLEEKSFDESIMEHASHVTSCLFSWVECAKLKATSKAIPEGYYLMPLQPSKEMIASAESEFEDLEIDDIQDRIVFAHQAMIQTHLKSTKQ